MLIVTHFLISVRSAKSTCKINQ